MAETGAVTYKGMNDYLAEEYESKLFTMQLNTLVNNRPSHER